MPCPNVKDCPCKSLDCENHSKCCACVENHRKKQNLPVCFRPEQLTAKSDQPPSK